MLKVVQVTADDDAVTWDQYVLGHPSATGYHLMGWRWIIERAFAHPACYLMAKDTGGNVRGVFPLVFLSSRMFGRFLVSMPFVNYGGILADTTEAGQVLLQAAVRVARDLHAEHMEVRHYDRIYGQLPSKQHKASMRLDLPSDYRTLWNLFPSKLRSQIRRAHKAGLTVKIGGEEILDDFYAVFARNSRDLGTPVYGPTFFKKIVEIFPKDARVCVVYLEHQAVAAGILYGFRSALEIPWAASDRRYNHLASNMLLYSAVLRYACQEKFQVFDFGRSTPGSSTYKFKEQWGAWPIPLSWAYWTCNGKALPDISPNNPKYQLAIRLWKQLPLGMANRLGPLIARAIP